ncbi:MAG TPA: tetratricopeptide repeat protein [Thermodesulfobacteriota bacterium]|nr:tetratricopeptide repeat protein [Thermodesulfobacteriota bacterium]
MESQEARGLFERGRELLLKGRPREALACFDAALELEPSDARLLSHRGLCLALFERRLEEGLALCRRAVELEFYRAEHYLHLAKVYLHAGRKREAVRALRQGRTIEPEHPGIRRELEALGIRRPPVLRCLPRRHVLNRHLGLLRARLSRGWR